MSSWGAGKEAFPPHHEYVSMPRFHSFFSSSCYFCPHLHVSSNHSLESPPQSSPISPSNSTWKSLAQSASVNQRVALYELDTSESRCTFSDTRWECLWPFSDACSVATLL